MNREIKFRIWSKERNKFVYSDDYVIDLEGEIKVRTYSDLYDDYWLAALNQDSYIVQQFTGLKDNKGVEICEGDFVKISFDAMFSKVKFDGDTEYKEIMCLPGSYVKRTSRTREVKWIRLGFNNFSAINEIGVCFRPNQELEVIGNIFENPELRK